MSTLAFFAGEVDETIDADQTNTVEINIATHCQEENDDKVCDPVTQQSSPDSAVVEEWKLRCLTLQSQVSTDSIALELQKKMSWVPRWGPVIPSKTAIQISNIIFL